MNLVIFLIIIFILLGLVFLASLYLILNEGEEKMVLDQLIKESEKLKKPDEIQRIYDKNDFSSPLYKVDFYEHSFKIWEKKNRKTPITFIRFADIKEVKKEYGGRKTDIPGHNFVWSRYGLTIVYLDGIVTREKTIWLTDKDKNKFRLLDNIKYSIYIDAIIYKLNKIKNVA